MRKNGLKTRMFSLVLAMSMATTSVYFGPIMETQAASDEGTISRLYPSVTYDTNYDAKNAYSGNDLGCTYTKEKTTFKVWSPEATKVVLCRYEKGDGGSAMEEKEMTKGDKGVWSITINGDIVNTYYTYKVTVGDRTKEAVDIYAKATGVNGDRAMVVDLDSTDPANWDKNYKREKTKLSDISVWEIHIRDFSIDVSSGVSAENRGKYKAFTESTTVGGKGKVASCVDYLKELGVTHVQMMPMYDYASVDETKVTNSLGDNYNWGYDPENYNVPEGSYSSNPYDGNVRITEMKEMIQALHDAGIKVIMDVVYNHTYATAESNFNKIMPDYYYKLDGNKYNDNSGCGNATRSESAMYRKFMIDSVTYWAEEYNLDGFRFDLMGIHDVTTMNEIRKTLDEKFGEDTIVLYGEGWTGDGKYDSNSAHKANESKLDNGIGYFNDQIRDAIKGEHKFDGTIGLVQANYTTGSYLEVGEKWPNNVFGGIMGSVGQTSGQWGMWRPFWSKSSDCVLAYTSAHDNLTLWDKLSAVVGKQYNSTDEKMFKMNKMAGAVVLLSRGGYFLQAGEEFARTKNGDDNSHKSPDSANKIDWTRLETYDDIRQYYQGMLSIRQAFSGITAVTTRNGDNWNPTGNNITWLSKDAEGVTAYTESNKVSGEWNKIAVIINNKTTEQSVKFTDASNWVVIADGNKAGIEKLSESGSTIKAPAKSVVVAVPKDTYDANIASVREKLAQMHNTNHAPVITADKTEIEASVGDTVEFTISTTDADGDAVTVAAQELPKSAKFVEKTGKVSWENVTAGTHKFVFTATDGKATGTLTVIVKVTSKTQALSEMIEMAEGLGATQSNVTTDVYKTFTNALTQAKAISSGETDEEKINSAYNSLKSAYTSVKAQLDARESLNVKIGEAEQKLASAKVDASNYDAEAIADLETVIETEKAYLEKAHGQSEYAEEVEELEYAMKACVSNRANPYIRVKASGWDTPAVYIWTGSGDSAQKLAGAWPGTKLTTKDAEGYYVFELPQGTTNYNVIVNDGVAGTATQTSNIEDIADSADIEVSSFTGKTCKYTMEPKTSGTGVVEVDKTRLERYLEVAKTYGVDKDVIPQEIRYTNLAKAYAAGVACDKDENATQVDVNCCTRTLRTCIAAFGSEIIVTPIVTPIISPEPSITAEPTITVEPTITAEPTISVAPTVTPEPVKGKVRIHFKSESEQVTVYYQNRSDAANKNVWREADMLSEGENWYSFDIENSTSARLYIEDENGTTNSELLGEGEFWYVNGVWESERPQDIVIVTPDPTSGATPKPTEKVTESPKPTNKVTETPEPTGKVTESPKPTNKVTAAPEPTRKVTVAPKPTNKVTESPKPTGKVTESPQPTKKVTQAPKPTKKVTNTPTPTKKATATPTPIKKVTVTPTALASFSCVATQKSLSSVKVKWSKVKNAESYRIYRATSANGKYVLVGVTEEEDATSYIDNNVDCGKKYYYYMKAYYENTLGKNVCVAKSKVSSVKLQVGKASLSSIKKSGNKIKVAWKKVSGVSGYEVYISTSKNGTYTRELKITRSTKISGVTKKLPQGKYYVKIRAYKTVDGKKVYGKFSNVKSVSIK